jgi:hypothetical protein
VRVQIGAARLDAGFEIVFVFFYPGVVVFVEFDAV